jgi:hypothetical protein
MIMSSVFSQSKVSKDKYIIIIATQPTNPKKEAVQSIYQANQPIYHARKQASK